MALYRIEDTTLTDIANAIRSKIGSSAALSPSEMASAIALISGEGGGAEISFLLGDNATTVPLSAVTGLSVNSNVVLQVLLDGVAIWGEKAKFTNKLPLATDTDRATIYGSDYNGDGVNDGYLASRRLSSSGSVSTANETCRASGFIPATVGNVIRIKGTHGVSGTSTYVIAYNSSNTKTNYQTFSTGVVISHPTYTNVCKYNTSNWYTIKDDIIEFTLTADKFGSGFDAIRFSGYMDENTIVTVNEEIVE